MELNEYEKGYLAALIISDRKKAKDDLKNEDLDEYLAFSETVFKKVMPNMIKE